MRLPVLLPLRIDSEVRPSIGGLRLFSGGMGIVETASRVRRGRRLFRRGELVSAMPISPISLVGRDDFVAAGADGDAHQESGDDSERDAHGEAVESGRAFRGWRRPGTGPDGEKGDAPV